MGREEPRWVGQWSGKSLDGQSCSRSILTQQQVANTQVAYGVFVRFNLDESASGNGGLFVKSLVQEMATTSFQSQGSRQNVDDKRQVALAPSTHRGSNLLGITSRTSQLLIRWHVKGEHKAAVGCLFGLVLSILGFIEVEH